MSHITRNSGESAMTLLTSRSESYMSALKERKVNKLRFMLRTKEERNYKDVIRKHKDLEFI